MTVSIQLNEMRRVAVPVDGIVGYGGPAQGARSLSVQPSGDAALAEDVLAVQPHRHRVLLVAYGADAARSDDLLLRRRYSQTLKGGNKWFKLREK